MTRNNPTTSVDRSDWTGRRQNARSFLKAASDLLTLADSDDNGNPIMSQALLATIAYADALTIQVAGVKNIRDHAALPDVLANVLGHRADQKQMQRLRRMIAEKNSIQYEQVTTTREEAETYIEQARRFAQWAEAELALGTTH